MPEALVDEFSTDPLLIQRFNAWRQLTLDLPPSESGIPDEQATHYSPFALGSTSSKRLKTKSAG
jgi:hypothetical protein